MKNKNQNQVNITAADQEMIRESIMAVLNDIKARGLDACVNDVQQSKFNVSEKQILRSFSQSFLKVAHANR